MAVSIVPSHERSSEALQASLFSLFWLGRKRIGLVSQLVGFWVGGLVCRLVAAYDHYYPELNTIDHSPSIINNHDWFLIGWHMLPPSTESNGWANCNGCSRLGSSYSRRFSNNRGYFNGRQLALLKEVAPEICAMAEDLEEETEILEDVEEETEDVQVPL